MMSMEEYIISELLSVVFPTAWAALSLILFGKNVFCFVKSKYHNHGLYEGDADTWISGIAFAATIVFMLFSIVDIAGLANLLANQLSSDPIMAYLLSYPLRWAIATIVDFIFCSIAWNIYLRHYIERFIYA